MLKLFQDGVCVFVLINLPFSASPLNVQAAELWDKDPAEFKRLVLARHQDLDEE